MTSMNDLITQVRYLTNTESNQFITNPELQYYLNASLGELDDILVSKQEDYRMTDVIIPILPGMNPDGTPLNKFPLPADFYQLRGVDYYSNGVLSNPWQTLDRYMFKERNKFANPLIRTPFGTLYLSYKLQDGYVSIMPEYAAAGNYRLFYIPTFTELNFTDPIPSYFENQAWREYAVVDASIKVLNKQNLDPTGLWKQKADLKSRIQAMSGHRDSGDPKCVINNSSAYDDYGIYGGRGSY